MPTPATKSKKARSSAEAATQSLNLIQATVLEYLSINRVEDHISTMATCLAAHVHFVTDEDEQCLTIDVGEFTQQVYHITDLITLLCTISRHHRDANDYAELATMQSKAQGSAA